MTYRDWLIAERREHNANSYEAWFREACAQGLPPDNCRPRNPKWTNATAVQAVQKYVRTHGKLPRSHPPEAYKGCPSPGTAQLLFGGWRKMLAAAGYDYKTQRERRLEKAS